MKPGGSEALRITDTPGTSNSDDRFPPPTDARSSWPPCDRGTSRCAPSGRQEATGGFPFPTRPTVTGVAAGKRSSVAFADPPKKDTVEAQSAVSATGGLSFPPHNQSNE